MGRWIDGLCKVLEGVIALALALMVVLVFGNVVLRYGFNAGITVSEELSRWLFIWGTFLGAVIALHRHAHMGVDMVVRRLPPALQRACLVLGHLLMLGIVAMLFQGSLVQTRINWDVTAPTTGWSMAWVTSAGLVFSVLAAVVLLYDLARIVTGRIADDALVMVQDSEETAQLNKILQEAGATRGGGRP
jgi:TRAP-type C4-dicarboxylate transport system permease small subunit